MPKKKLNNLSIHGYYKGWNETEAAAAKRIKISTATFQDIQKFNTEYQLFHKSKKLGSITIDENNLGYRSTVKTIKRPTGVSNKDKYAESVRKLAREIQDLPEGSKLTNLYASWGTNKNNLVSVRYNEEVDPQIIKDYFLMKEKRTALMVKVKEEKKKNTAAINKEKKEAATLKAKEAKEKAKALEIKKAKEAKKKEEAARLQKIIEKLGTDKLEELEKLLEKTA
jgi:hypothetical protein